MGCLSRRADKPRNWHPSNYRGRERTTFVPSASYVIYEDNDGLYDIIPVAFDPSPDDDIGDEDPCGLLLDYGSHACLRFGHDFWSNLDPITAQAVLIHLQQPPQGGEQPRSP